MVSEEIGLLATLSFRKVHFYNKNNDLDFPAAIRCLPWMIRCYPSVVRYLPWMIRCCPSVVRCLPWMVRCRPSIVRCAPWMIRCWPFIICCPPWMIRCPPAIIRCLPFSVRGTLIHQGKPFIYQIIYSNPFKLFIFVLSSQLPDAEKIHNTIFFRFSFNM